MFVTKITFSVAIDVAATPDRTLLVPPYARLVVKRVLTWNLWWKFGPWEERQPAIIAELRATDPDVVLLQEVWASGVDDQAVLLGQSCGLHSLRTTNPDGRPQEFGNAILSRWPMQHLETISLTGPDGTPSHRSAMAVIIDAPSGAWIVIVTHLSWQYDQSRIRERQLAEIVALAARHRLDGPEAPPLLLGGDFNAVPESDEIRRLTGLSRAYVDGLVFTDCWAAVGNGPGHTWTRDNPHAADALWPRRRLDYLFVSWPRPRPLGNPLSAALVGIYPHDGVVGSDHYGVLVELDPRAPTQESR